MKRMQPHYAQAFITTSNLPDSVEGLLDWVGDGMAEAWTPVDNVFSPIYDDEPWSGPHLQELEKATLHFSIMQLAQRPAFLPCEELRKEPEYSTTMWKSFWTTRKKWAAGTREQSSLTGS